MTYFFDSISKARSFSLLDEMFANTESQSERFSIFEKALNEQLKPKQEAHVLGEPISILEVGIHSDEYECIVAVCQRENGQTEGIALSDLLFPFGSSLADLVSAYRMWFGHPPLPRPTTINLEATKELKIKLDKPIELVVLSAKNKDARCRLLDSKEELYLRAKNSDLAIPGMILKVDPKKSWALSGHNYLSGKIESSRLDIEALQLPPMHIEDCGAWDPNAHYWGEDDDPAPEYQKEMTQYGNRPMLELESALYESGQAEAFSAAVELQMAGDGESAKKLLMDICHKELRCFEVHGLLGYIVSEDNPKQGILHNVVGVELGKQQLKIYKNPVLEWGFIENRAFLKCFYGYASNLWRLGELKKAKEAFTELLWLNPSDNQGVRFVMNDLAENRSWDECRG